MSAVVFIDRLETVQKRVAAMRGSNRARKVPSAFRWCAGPGTRIKGEHARVGCATDAVPDRASSELASHQCAPISTARAQNFDGV